MQYSLWLDCYVGFSCQSIKFVEHYEHWSEWIYCGTAFAIRQVNGKLTQFINPPWIDFHLKANNKTDFPLTRGWSHREGAALSTTLHPPFLCGAMGHGERYGIMDAAQYAVLLVTDVLLTTAISRNQPNLNWVISPTKSHAWCILIYVCDWLLRTLLFLAIKRYCQTAFKYSKYFENTWQLLYVNSRSPNL